MRQLERTRQQLDPIGALPTRMLAVALAAGAVIYSTVLTFHTVDQIVNPLLAVLALLWLAGASLTVAIASSPHRAPFTAATHMAVLLLAVGAAALSAASQWGVNKFIQDDFGPIALGLLILSMGVYRPAKELASMGVVAAIFVGFITLLKVPGLETAAPPMAFVLVGMTPVLALAFGAAAYSGRLVGELEKWQSRTAQSMTTASNRLTDGIAQSVRQDRVRILDREVFPFFTSILGKDTVTESDRVQARQVAESIRALMVAEADRTWLEVVAGDDGIAPDDMHRSVVDVGGYATGMVAGQRTVLRAFIIALREDASFVSESLNVTVTGASSKCKGILTASIHDAERNPHVIFGPYFAVMRVVFSELQLEFHNNKLTVRFSYEQR